MLNLKLMSRTANGIVDTSASTTKKDVMEAIDGKEAARLAEKNYRTAIEFEINECSRIFASPAELRIFIEKIAGMINGGILKKGSLIRSGADSIKWNYTRIADLENAMGWFYKNLYERLTAEKYDPVETAAFTEYYMNKKIHMWADGCCKTSIAVSAYMMLRGGLMPVRYKDRDEYYETASIDSLNDCGSDEDIYTYTAFYRYYQSLMPSDMPDLFPKMRRISVDGCKLIGSGKNGRVYRLDAETIVKVYSPKNHIQDLLQEKKLARWAFVNGVPTAISFDVVKVGANYGTVFEMLEATSVSQLILHDPDNMEYYLQQYVDLMKRIHHIKADTSIMEDRKKSYTDNVYAIQDSLKKETVDKLLKLLSAIPDDVTLLHGDIHTDNVLKTKQELMVIDMDMLGYGNPIFDFANLYSTLIGFFILERELDVVHVPRSMNRKIWDMTLRLYYSELDEQELKKLNDKIAVLSMVRLLKYCCKHDYPEEDADLLKANLEYRLDTL